MRSAIVVLAGLLAPLSAQETRPAKPAQAKPAQAKPAQAKPKHLNHLAGETSPYLLSHRHNPVHWYPWGKEALDRARREDKPIFLSIGYSACHWCHVMERESFENEAIAKVMNQHFICIKVDREERPDLDQIYMSAVQRMTGSGGWPMSVWLTPEQKPFYGGTYFPPRDMRGRPGFKKVLESIAQAWKTQRAAIDKGGNEMATYLRQALIPRRKPGKLGLGLLVKAAAQSASRWDRKAGGFAGGPRYAPKFPHAAELTVLLLQHARNGDKEALRCVEQTLVNMRNGGIYDQVGGGFHRYSTDRQWLVPHFEKMLYDNALLAQTYTDAYRHTGKSFYAEVVRQTLDYMLREMQHPAGGFYSATDADSEGVEGKFFVWKKAELDRLLGADSKIFCAAYGVTEAGNWHEMPGDTVLSVVKSTAQLADEFELLPKAVEKTLRQARQRLYEVRKRRVPPMCDDKVLTAWNGMAITAMARGYKLFGDGRYLESAQRAAEFALTTMRRKDGRLYRTWRNGDAKLAGYLPDYAYLAEALTQLFEADFDPKWLAASRDLLGEMQKHFLDPADHSFFYTADDHEVLLARSKSVEESSIPSGVAVAIAAFARAGVLLEDQKLVEIARQALESNHLYLDQHPTAVMTMMQSVDFLLHEPREVVIAGDPAAADTKAFLVRLRQRWPAGHLVTLVHDGNRAALAELVPGIADKMPRDGKATAYVCQFGVCQAPVSEPSQLKF